MNRRKAAGLLVAAAMAACSRPAPPVDPDQAIVPLAAATVDERVRTGLRMHGLTVLGRAVGPGAIEAVGDGPVGRGWADCPVLRLSDPSRRTNRTALIDASEVATRVLASVRAVSVGETRLAVRAQHTGIYVNPFTNHTQRGACATTGALERVLLEAAAL